MKKHLPNEKNTSSLLIFLHIPKTGGMTFDGILQKNFKRREILSCYARRGLSLNKIYSLQPKKLRQYRCVRGNFPFGIHSLFQNPVKYITFVRNPITQIISNYRFIVKSDKKEDRAVKANMSLHDFALSIEDNFQTRYIAGKLRDQEYSASIKLLEQALTNIENHFAFVGITERFDESLILIQQIIGLKRIDYCSRNINKRIDRNQKVSRRTINLIESRFELDFRLYKFVEDMLEFRIKTYDSGFFSKFNSLQKAKPDNFIHKKFFDFFNYNYDRLVEYLRYQFFFMINLI